MDKFIDAFINQWIPIVNHWLHLMSAILWIGGLGLLMMAVVPSLRKSVPGELVKPLANAIYRKYQRIIGALMLIILVTGGINIAYVNRLMKTTNGEGFTNPYLIALGIKQKSTRLNSSHTVISYAVFCLKKKKNIKTINNTHMHNNNA